MRERSGDAAARTLSQVSQRKDEWAADELLVAAQLRLRSFRNERKRNNQRFFRQLASGEQITNHRGGFFQAALPIRLASIAENECVGIEARGGEHGASQFQKSRPARGDAEKYAGRRGQPSGQRRGHGTNLQREQFDAVRQRLPHGFFLAGQRDADSAHKLRRILQIVQAAASNRQRNNLLHLDGENAPQFFVGLDQEKMIGRLQLEPVAQAGAHGGQRNAELARRKQQFSHKLIERMRRRERGFGLGVADVAAAAAPEFNPALALELAIAGADGIRMQSEAPGQLASARQTLACGQIIAQDAENNLGDELLTQRDGAFVRKPELHRATF